MVCATVAHVLPPTWWLQVVVSADSEDIPGAYEMKQMWIRVGTPLIKNQLAVYLKKLADG